MGRDKTIKFLRTTKANLETQKTGSNLLVGEPYLITDEARIAIGTANNSYSEMALKSEVGGSPSTVVCGETLSAGDIVQQVYASGNPRVLKIKDISKISLAKNKQITNLANYVYYAWTDYFDIAPNIILTYGWGMGVRLLHLDMTNLTGTTPITLLTSLSVTGNLLNVIQISTNTFVAISFSGTSVYGKAFTVSNSSITAGSNFAIADDLYDSCQYSVCSAPLSNNKFVVLYYGGESYSYGYTKGKTFSVSGTTISAWNSNIYTSYDTWYDTATLIPMGEFGGIMGYKYYSGGTWYYAYRNYKVSSSGVPSVSSAVHNSSSGIQPINYLLGVSNYGVMKLGEGAFCFDRVTNTGYLTLTSLLFSMSSYFTNTTTGQDIQLRLQLSGAAQSEYMGATLRYINDRYLVNIYRDANYIYIDVYDMRFNKRVVTYKSDGEGLSYSGGNYTPSILIFGNRYMAIYYYDSSDGSNYYTLLDLGLDMNILGIMQESGTSGQTKTIALKGQISTVHSGLVIGAKYYLEGGKLTLKKNDNFVGTAIDTTKLLVGL